jgi:hypothetical protein
VVKEEYFGGFPRKVWIINILQFDAPRFYGFSVQQMTIAWRVCHTERAVGASRQMASKDKRKIAHQLFFQLDAARPGL